MTTKKAATKKPKGWQALSDAEIARQLVNPERAGKLDPQGLRNEAIDRGIPIPMVNSVGHVTLSTLEQAAGHRVTSVLGVVSAERAIVASDLSGLDQGIGAAFEKLDSEREACMSWLRQQAIDLGANVVLGVRFSTVELSTLREPLVLLSAHGTAVVVEAETVE